MKINLTKKEYQSLLDMLYIADWVLHAHVEEKTEETKEYKELEQKMLELAEEFGMKDCMECSEKTGELFLTKDYIDKRKAMPLVEKFENATFWEELLERIARRDFIRLYGKKTIMDMAFPERFEKEMLVHKMYDDEFAKNGLENLYINWNVDEKKKN